MSDFSDWEFMLNGDSQEFRLLASKVGSCYFNIYGSVDHWLDCPNDDFRMTTLYCERESDAAVIWQLGHELISLFNGASVLLSRTYKKASIFKLLHRGKPVNYVAPSGSSALLGKPPMDQQRIDQEFQNGLESSIKFPLIHLATENQDIYFILKYLNMDGSWTNYYKLMEAVETFAKQKNIDLETSNSRQKSFTNTANNFLLSGFDSRHGFKELAKQNKTPSMSLDEGYAFITDMAKAYLRKAYFDKIRVNKTS